MFSARRLHHTYEDYLRLERESPVRHEYFDGEIYAMAGGTPEHGLLCAELITLIHAQLPEGCRVMTSDVRVRIEESDLTTYPDATVVCGALQRSPKDEHAVVNPVLLVEVTSASTEDYDRGEKLSHYRQLASLRAVLIVSHRSRRVTVLERTDGAWGAPSEFRASETVACGEPRLSIPVDRIYSVLEGI